MSSNGGGSQIMWGSKMGGGSQKGGFQSVERGLQIWGCPKMGEGVPKPCGGRPKM